MPPTERDCPRCLLFGVGNANEEERLFQAALRQDPEQRTSFLREAAGADSALFDAVQMLLAGHAEAGGDPEDAFPVFAEGPTDSVPASNEEPGAQIGHFRLVRRVGEGGMGSVWQAEQTEPVRRTVALKVIKWGMDTRDVVRRFQRERRTLALLNHPNIAQVYEAGSTATGRPYFAMEFVDGRPITEHCQAAGLDIPARLRLFREVCAAVEHAHQKGVIHRDLKPSNLLVADGVPKVIDFGLARATHESGTRSLLTRATQVVGTPAYMSPEQARTAGTDVDTRTDVYSLGVVLYEILTGTPPIDPGRLASTDLAGVQRILQEEDPPTPSVRLRTSRRSPGTHAPARELPPIVPGDLDQVVMKALRKDRNERYASAAAFSEDIQRWLDGEPVSAVPPTFRYRASRFIRRNRVAVSAAAIVLMALVGALGVSLVQAHQARVALAGEVRAREETTFTVADMYTRSGLAAAEAGQPNRPALWFANAAIIGARDPDRTSANRIRMAAWRDDSFTPVRAIETGFDYLQHISWNPKHPAVLVESDAGSRFGVWDIEQERPWDPAGTARIASAGWSPSGDHLAVLHEDGALRVIGYPSGGELARLPEPASGAAEWDKTGHWIAVGNRLWNWQSGEQRRLPRQASWASFSGDSRLVMVGWEEQVTVCSMEAPEEPLFTPVACIARNGARFLDTATIVVGSPEGGLRIHDARTGQVLQSHPAQGREQHSGIPLASSPDGRWIARNSAQLLDRTTGKPTGFPRHEGYATAAAFSHDGTLLASGGYDRRLQLWSVPEGRFLGDVGHHHSAVLKIEFSPDDRFVASAENGLLRVWRVRRKDLVSRIPHEVTTRAAVSPDGLWIAAAGHGYNLNENRSTRVYGIASRKPAGPGIQPNGFLLHARFHPSGEWLALAVSTAATNSLVGAGAPRAKGGEGNVQFWNFRTGVRIGEPVRMPSEPRYLALHPSGRWLGVLCGGGEAVEIDLQDRSVRVLFRFEGNPDSYLSSSSGECAYSPDGRIFAAWGYHEYTQLFDRELRREWIRSPEPRQTTLDLDFHGETVVRAVGAPEMQIRFHNTADGAPSLAPIPYVSWPFVSRFNATGDLLLTAGGGGLAQVWHWREGRLACPMLPHSKPIMAACFVPRSPWIITGDDDGIIRFWDSRTGMMIRPPLQRSASISALQMTPDGRTLVVSGWFDRDIELVDLPDAMPEPDLDPESARLLCEIDAGAVVHPGGGLAQLARPEWMAKWREFRRRHPDYPGHQLGW